MRNESGRGAETAYAVCTALQRAEARRSKRCSPLLFLNFVNSLHFVLPALSMIQSSAKLSLCPREHMEANCGSTLLSRLVFRRTRDQERMAIQWATTLKSCSGQQQKLDVETVTCRAHPQVTVTWAMEHRRHGHSFSWREHTYTGKPQLSSSFSACSTCILCSFSSQER